jgi:hypothetical protein
VLSIRIEGTQATLGELLAAEAGAVVERSPADLHEGANYVVALEHGVGRLRALPLSLRLVRELHGKLMQGVRGNTATPGEFRRSQNWIGRPGCTLADATYVPPPVDQRRGRRQVGPPLRDQYVIVELRDRETARSDTLMTKVRVAIDRPKELRTALISAAVTGQIDVREHAA